MQGIAQWTSAHSAWPLAAALAACSLALLALAFWLRRRWRRAERAVGIAGAAVAQLQAQHDALRDAIDGLRDGVALFDADDRLVVCNRSYAESFARLSDARILGMRYVDLLRAGLQNSPWPNEAARERFIAKCVDWHRQGGKPWLHRLPDDRTLRIKEQRLSNGCTVGIYSNVTEFVRLQRELEAAERAAASSRARLEDGVESLGEAFALWDSDDRLVICNQRYREMFAYAADLMVPGTSFEAVVRQTVERGHIPEAVGREEEWIAKRLALHREPAGPVLHPMPDDRWLRVDERRTRDGGYVGVRSDVTEMVRGRRTLQQLNERLARLSNTDGLTGVANRRAWDDTLRTEWMRGARHGQPLALVIVDIDHFKQYNDHYGHVAGDACLQQIASVLGACTRRAGDLVARYGGEEFALLLPSSDAAAALAMARRCVEAVREARLPHAGSGSGFVTISAGAAAAVPERTAPPESLTRAADAALYRVKQAGRDDALLADAPAAVTGEVP